MPYYDRRPFQASFGHAGVAADQVARAAPGAGRINVCTRIIFGVSSLEVTAGSLGVKSGYSNSLWSIDLLGGNGVVPAGQAQTFDFPMGLRCGANLPLTYSVTGVCSVVFIGYDVSDPEF